MKAPKEKKKVRGLIFDVIILLLVLGSILAGLFLTLKPEKIITAEVEYKVVFNTVKKSIASNISLGDEFLSENGDAMGKIISALNENKMIETLNRNLTQGEYVSNVSNEYNTVKATICATAVYQNGSYYIGGQPLRAGEQLALRLPNFYGVAIVTAVTIETK